jgi:signal transduction histidine kinase
MKPILSESEDNQSLQLIGRASLQVVHDLKNQLNGLKLYATFLRKRLEKSERPADELETINKLIAGLDRGATDLSLIGLFSQPLNLRKHRADLNKLADSVASELNEKAPTTGSLRVQISTAAAAAPLFGEFDVESLSQALSWITLATLKWASGPGGSDQLEIGLAEDTGSFGVVSWPIPEGVTHDPFRALIGSDGVKLALAARIVEAHGGTAERFDGRLRIRLPLNS